MRRLAVIPARGGSKRLPRKNVVAFAGRPIIAHTIEAAATTGLFESVVVSTEDAEIAAAAQAAGARVVERSARLASDEARVVDVCLEVLEREEAAGRAYGALCCLYATAPLRTAEDVAATVGLLEPGRCDFALAVTTYDYPPHQALRPDGAGGVEPMWPELVNRRGGEIGPLYVDNGSTYAVHAEPFRRARTFYGAPLRAHVMPRERSVDIDLPEDLARALAYAEGSRR